MTEAGGIPELLISPLLTLVAVERAVLDVDVTAGMGAKTIVLLEAVAALMLLALLAMGRCEDTLVTATKFELLDVFEL